jgi:hypothetical protein
MTTALNQQAQVNLNAVFKTHGHQKEIMVDQLLKLRQQAANQATQDERQQAEQDITDFLSQPSSQQQAHSKLANDRTSPYVSRDAQAAVLKGMILDYEKGRRRPGLSALTVLRAVELLNKMTGYEAPVKQEVTHEHKVNVLPIIGESFKGELEPLDVIDIDGQAVADTSSTLPTQTYSTPTPTPAPAQEPEEVLPDF